ncbi:MAG: NUDIX domain-containing protein [Candidatus Saccharimonadales bacterium]
MKKHSAGLIVFRRTSDGPEVLIAHMGSPWWAKKDIGAWSIPKGEIEEGEDALQTAKREFAEELGLPSPKGEYIQLGVIEQHNNKTVAAWAIEANVDASSIKSNTFKVEWPPKSGKMQDFPEIDRAEWFSLSEAAKRVVRGQAELFERLAKHLDVNLEADSPQQGSLF